MSFREEVGVSFVVFGVLEPQIAPPSHRKREKKTYSQTSRLENPEELQLHHNHEKFLFLTVLSLFAECKMNQW
jgi:hypothetical protein